MKYKGKKKLNVISALMFLQPNFILAGPTTGPGPFWWPAHQDRPIRTAPEGSSRNKTGWLDLTLTSIPHSYSHSHPQLQLFLGESSGLGGGSQRHASLSSRAAATSAASSGLAVRSALIPLRGAAQPDLWAPAASSCPAAQEPSSRTARGQFHGTRAATSSRPPPLAPSGSDRSRSGRIRPVSDNWWSWP